MIQSAVFRKYTYDAIYQLLTVSRTGSSTLNLIFTYDGVGNRLTQNKDGAVTNYAYNDGNQLISNTYLAWGNVTQFFYLDNNGNNTGNAIPNFGSVCQIAYDYENRGISFTANWGVATTYTYDAFSRMTSRTLNGVTAKYMYDGQNTVADYSGSNVCQASYVTPFLDCNLLISRTGTTYYYMQDGLGSVRNIVNSAQTVVNSYDYNAYGEGISQTEGVTNRFKFAGREYCAEEQGYFNRARVYAPMMGKFLQRDPIGYGGGTNIYGYCGNNPVNYIDPMGLKATWPLKTTAQTLPCPFDPSNPQPAMAQTLPYIIDYSKPQDESMYQLMSAQDPTLGESLEQGFGAVIDYWSNPGLEWEPQPGSFADQTYKKSKGWGVVVQSLNGVSLIAGGIAVGKAVALYGAKDAAALAWEIWWATQGEEIEDTNPAMPPETPPGHSQPYDPGDPTRTPADDRGAPPYEDPTPSPSDGGLIPNNSGTQCA